MFESSFILIVGVVVGIVVALLIVLALLSKNYIKVSPNQAAVISGRTRKLGDGTTVGYRQVRGGATTAHPASAAAKARPTARLRHIENVYRYMFLNNI